VKGNKLGGDYVGLISVDAVSEKGKIGVRVMILATLICVGLT
jgi:hypothetical protein